MPPSATRSKPLHPHTALWILLAVIILGALSYGTYLWQSKKDEAPAPSAPIAPTPLTAAQSQAILNSLKATSTASTTADKAPPVDGKTLNSLKAEGSASSSGQVNNSMLDSLKAR